MPCVTPPVLLAPLREGLSFRKLVPSESPKLSLLNLLASDKCFPFLRLYMWPEISKTCPFHFITSTRWPNFCLTQELSLSFWMLSWRVQVSWCLHYQSVITSLTFQQLYDTPLSFPLQPINIYGAFYPSVHYGSWFDHIKGWTSHSNDIQNFLYITYEEMWQVR